MGRKLLDRNKKTFKNYLIRKNEMVYNFNIQYLLAWKAKRWAIFGQTNWIIQ